MHLDPLTLSSGKTKQQIDTTVACFVVERNIETKSH